VEPSGGPTLFWVGSKRPSRLLYFTKVSAFDWWKSLFGTYWDTPADFAVCAHGLLPTVDACRRIRVNARLLKLPLCFVGDLDPGDLSTYLALGSGGPDLKMSIDTRMNVNYLGMGGRLLELCRRHIGAEALHSVCVQMSPLEIEHFNVLKQVFPKLPKLVGPNAFRLLESGLKVELEGATYQSLQNKKFANALKSFFRRAEPS
jgi:hypothetical protein